MGPYDEFEVQELQRRYSLYTRAVSTASALHFTYKRKYLAAEWVGRLGWFMDLFTGIVGIILLYVLTREGNPTFPLIAHLSSLNPPDLAIILLVTSLISSFYGPKLRSRDYYNGGQELQELYDDVIDFIVVDLHSQEQDMGELHDKYIELNKIRHELNQTTPQLGGHWYKLIKLKQWYNQTAPWKEYSDWEPPEFNIGSPK